MGNPRTTNEVVKESITQALLELMKTKHISEITVKEITERAGVGRVSFYRNYGSKETVIIRYMDELTIEWGKAFEQEENPNIIKSLFTHFYQDKDLLNLLYSSGLEHLILQSLRNVCGPKPEHNNIQAYWQAMLSGAIYSWCIEWIHRGMMEMPEEIARLNFISHE